jgi:hypothetical protein
MQRLLATGLKAKTDSIGNHFARELGIKLLSRSNHLLTFE